MIKGNITILTALLIMAAAVSILGCGCRIAGNGDAESAPGFTGSIGTIDSREATGVPKSDGARNEDALFSKPAAGVPLISCLYFDEASFKNAAASAVIFEEDITLLNGGIVPHHLLAGGMIASFWKTVSQRDYDLIVIIGPDHERKGRSDVTTITSGFETIYGDVVANLSIANALIQENLALEDPKVMIDHAVSSHIPFISYYMPNTPVLPLLVKGSCSAGKIRALADYILKITEGMDVLYVASMDFSHYLPLEEANEKDRYTEQVLASFDYDKIMEMTNDHLDSRPSALYLLHTMSELCSKSMTKWDHSNSDIISNTITGYTTSYFLFGFFEEPERQPDEKSNALNIIAVGDIMLGRGVASSLKAQRLDFIHPFTQVKSILDEGDIVFGNLEHPIAESSESLNPEFKYILKCETEAVAGLSFAGFDVLSLANNHIMDYYETGLMDTLSILEKNNIAPVGAGCSLNDATKPVIIERNGIRVGFLAYTDMADTVYAGNPPIKFSAGQNKAGVAPLRPAIIEEDIRMLRSNVDILAVSLHWGIEDSYDVTGEQIELAHKICDSGADIIFGHHPHRFQGMEIYRGKPIIYSLGNFIFDQVPENQESFILCLAYEGSVLTGLRAIPIRTVNHSIVVPQKDSKAKEMIGRVIRLSKELGTECTVENDSLICVIGDTR